MRAGQLFEVSDGARRAVVTEQGATLFRVNWEGVELLSTVSDDGYAGFGCHGELLVPWPGRVAAGTYDWEGERYQLPINDHASGSAIHGWARWSTWRPISDAPGSLTLANRSLARPGYPFCFDLEQAYTWHKDRLDIAFSAVNIGDAAAPFGYGCHPYFSVGSAVVDSDVLRAPAASYFEVDANLNPVGKALPVDGTAYDFRAPRAIGTAALDVTLADLERDAGGCVTVELRSPDGERAVRCRYGAAVEYLQLFSGDTLPEGRRRGLAIEPYTCAPNAFNNGLGLARVLPGGSVRVSWSISAVTT